MADKQYFVYILTNRSGTLYIGMTNNIVRRMHEHKHALVEGFAKRYRLNILVYYEMTSDVMSAITREKQLKGWVRRKKIALIENTNPGWKDLSIELGIQDPSPTASVGSG